MRRRLYGGRKGRGRAIRSGAVELPRGWATVSALARKGKRPRMRPCLVLECWAEESEECSQGAVRGEGVSGEAHADSTAVKKRHNGISAPVCCVAGMALLQRWERAERG